MYKSFRDMPVWQKALKLSIEIFSISVPLPRSEDYGLTSQIRRSSSGVAGNIAEAFGRQGAKDKIHFYTIARGSAYETQSHLLYGNKVGYWSDSITSQLLDEYDLLIHELNKIILSLRPK